MKIFRFPLHPLSRASTTTHRNATPHPMSMTITSPNHAIEMRLDGPEKCIHSKLVGGPKTHKSTFHTASSQHSRNKQGVEIGDTKTHLFLEASQVKQETAETLMHRCCACCETRSALRYQCLQMEQVHGQVNQHGGSQRRLLQERQQCQHFESWVAADAKERLCRKLYSQPRIHRRHFRAEIGLHRRCRFC